MYEGVKNQIIIQEGNLEQNLFFIIQGECKIYKNVGNNLAINIGFIGEGSFFGEQSVIYRETEEATF